MCGRLHFLFPKCSFSCKHSATKAQSYASTSIVCRIYHNSSALPMMLTYFPWSLSLCWWGMSTGDNSVNQVPTSEESQVTLQQDCNEATESTGVCGPASTAPFRLCLFSIIFLMKFWIKFSGKSMCKIVAQERWYGQYRQCECVCWLLANIRRKMAVVLCCKYSHLRNVTLHCWG